MTDEVAMFIDVENIRYGLLNEYGQEPNFQELVEKAKKYGRPTMMRAYADFSEHPSNLNRQLQIVGIDAINVPVKRNLYKGPLGKDVERIKNAADMVLALDAIMEAVEADTIKKKKTFLIASGDRDYVKLVTLLQNRFGQEVVIVGLPGSVAGDLIRAAGNRTEYLDVKKSKSIDMNKLKKDIVGMVKKGPSPLDYWTLRIIDDWVQSDRQAIAGTAKEKRDAISDLKNEKVLIIKERNDPKRGLKNEAILDEEEAKRRGYVV
jgi:uncharacterized LabA/DUF88 family protein